MDREKLVEDVRDAFWDALSDEIGIPTLGCGTPMVRHEMRVEEALAAALDGAEAAIREDEREACCRSMCSWCAAEWPLAERTAGAPFYHTNPSGTWKRWPPHFAACKATAIRARGDAP